jgi:lipopolysaccharide/colanic/teichoic acid biosynthesis glycosyltransferase
MKNKETFYSRYGKRWFELILTIPGFVVVSPLLGIIALLVRLQLGTPVPV